MTGDLLIGVFQRFDQTLSSWTYPRWTPAQARLDPGGCLQGREKEEMELQILWPCYVNVTEVLRLPRQQLLSYLREPAPSSRRRDQTCWPGRRTMADGGGCAPSRTWWVHVGAVDGFQNWGAEEQNVVERPWNQNSSVTADERWSE